MNNLMWLTKLVTAKAAVWSDQERIYLVIQGVLAKILAWGLNTDVKEGGIGPDNKDSDVK